MASDSVEISKMRRWAYLSVADSITLWFPRALELLVPFQNVNAAFDKWNGPVLNSCN